MYIKNEDTICAPATVPGTGAISVIRVSGPEALAASDKVVRCTRGRVADAKGYTMKFGTVVSEDGTVVDEVLVSVFRAPHSYTGENSVEISCHASSFIVSSIMDLLYAAGCRAAAPGEFTERAFLNGKMDLAQAEAVADVIASQNAAAHRIAFTQMKGGFSSELKSMRGELLEIVSLMELELDFSEEEVEFADRSRLDALLETVIGHVGRLIDSFRLGNVIKNGVPVAIAGATNTGKSTLLNALLGEERAIVSDVHGTTRDTIEEVLNIDGVLFRFIDTAGIRETSETVERIGIERTFKKISEASIVLGMIDLTREFEDSCTMVREILGKVDFSNQRLVFLLNKTDISKVNKNVRLINFIVSCADYMMISYHFTDSEFLKGISVDFSGMPYDLSRGLSESAGVAADSSGDSGEPAAGTSAKVSPHDSCLSSDSCAVSILPISAKTGAGIPLLRSLLASSQRNLLGDSDTTLVTNQRHVQALSDARQSLLRVRSGLADGLPTDLAAQDIREAIYHIGSIVGEISSDEVLGNIFRNFCIGK